jgi:hypothetical protein
VGAAVGGEQVGTSRSLERLVTART